MLQRRDCRLAARIRDRSLAGLASRLSSSWLGQTAVASGCRQLAGGRDGSPDRRARLLRYLLWVAQSVACSPLAGGPPVYRSTSSARTPGRMMRHTFRCTSISRASCSGLGASGRRTSRSASRVLATTNPERSKCARRSSSKVGSPVRSLMPQVLPVRRRIRPIHRYCKCSYSNLTESPAHPPPGEVNPTRA